MVIYALTRHARRPPCFGWWPPGWQIAASPTYFAPVRAWRPLSPQNTRAASRARHTSAPVNHPDAVSTTRPYLSAHHTQCPARAHTRKPPQCRAQHAPALQYRAQHAPASAHHALQVLRCPARRYAGGSFPGALDLGSAWCGATATEMLAAFNRTLTAYPRASSPRRLVAPLPPPPLPPRRLLRLSLAFLQPPLCLLEYMVMFPLGLSSVSLWCSLQLCCPFHFFYLIRNVWWRGF